MFAEDRVRAEGVFYNYYVFERRGDPCYLDPAGAASQPRIRGSRRWPPICRP